MPRISVDYRTTHGTSCFMIFRPGRAQTRRAPYRTCGSARCSIQRPNGAHHQGVHYSPCLTFVPPLPLRYRDAQTTVAGSLAVTSTAASSFGGTLTVAGAAGVDAFTVTNGDLRVTNGDLYGGDMLTTSDRRLKDNIAQLPSALETVRRIRGVRPFLCRACSRGRKGHSHPLFQSPFDVFVMKYRLFISRRFKPFIPLLAPFRLFVKGHLRLEGRGTGENTSTDKEEGGHWLCGARNPGRGTRACSQVWPFILVTHIHVHIPCRVWLLIYRDRPRCSQTTRILSCTGLPNKGLSGAPMNNEQRYLL